MLSPLGRKGLSSQRPLSKTPDDCLGHPTFTKNDGGNGTSGHCRADIPPAGWRPAKTLATPTIAGTSMHFTDTLISSDGTPTQPIVAPNMLTEVILLSRALGSSEAPRATRCESCCPLRPRDARYTEADLHCGVATRDHSQYNAEWMVWRIGTRSRSASTIASLVRADLNRGRLKFSVRAETSARGTFQANATV